MQSPYNSTTQALTQTLFNPLQAGQRGSLLWEPRGRFGRSSVLGPPRSRTRVKNAAFPGSPWQSPSQARFAQKFFRTNSETPAFHRDRFPPPAARAKLHRRYAVLSCRPRPGTDAKLAGRQSCRHRFVRQIRSLLNRCGQLPDLHLANRLSAPHERRLAAVSGTQYKARHCSCRGKFRRSTGWMRW